ncbi:HAD family hydrolase [Sulfitobacter sp. EhC04]|uniref:HAD family hydrolase n=1 Tax=Sulfitobacter sp. EhC04 TaxID=1849168 RepID=UPI000A498B7C|nr:HAD family hydrolase [Sulfitobacter sp. EhC04]
MSEIKGLLFDKDGTLFDFAATWEAWATAFLNRLCDGDHARALRAGARIGFDHDAGVFAPDSIVIAGTPGEVTEALLPSFPEFSGQQLITVLNEEAARAPQREAVPLIPLLNVLRGRGLALGVATNDAIVPARAHLSAAGIEGLFDFIAGFDSGHGAKPTPGQMQAFATSTGLPPERIAMIGDSAHDLVAGRAAGMVCVAVLTGMATADALAPLADVVLPDIGHLPAWLDAQIPPTD